METVVEAALERAEFRLNNNEKIIAVLESLISC